MAVRKNHQDLTDPERDRFVRALQAVKADGTVDRFAALHARHFSHGSYRSSHFLPWHREFLHRFETALRRHEPEVSIPYWNCSVDRDPAGPLWATGLLGQFDSAWQLRRTLGTDTLPTSRQVEAALSHTSYGAFWPELERCVHDPAHRWVGGTMAGVAAPGDPAFLLHHAWIDLLWAKWRIAHPYAEFTASMPGAGPDDPLPEWPDRTPSAVLDHHALDYRYDFESALPQRQLVGAGQASGR